MKMSLQFPFCVNQMNASWLGYRNPARHVEGRIMEQKNIPCVLFGKCFLVDLLQHLKHLPNKTTAVIFSVLMKCQQAKCALMNISLT